MTILAEMLLKSVRSRPVALCATNQHSNERARGYFPGCKFSSSVPATSVSSHCLLTCHSLPQVLFSRPLPGLSCQMNAWVTVLTCQWLMGPCEVRVPCTCLAFSSFSRGCT